MDHTKGKWTFGNHHCGDGMRVFVQHEADTDQHDAICDLETWQTEEETKSNAQLIASSPDLLEACKKARHQLWTKRKTFMESDHETMNLLSAVISKAEGKKGE